MAESGYQSEQLTRSVIGGSECLFDLYCNICDDEGRHVEAVGFCKTCDEHLCDVCFKTHRRPRPARHHVLLDKEHMPKNMPSVRTRISTDKCTDTCLKHPDKVIEYFCQSHQVLACSTCVIMEQHRTCERLDHIPEVSAGITNSKELRDMFGELASIENKAKNIMKTSKDNKSVAESLSSDAIISLKKFRKEVNDMLDTLEKSIEDETKKIKSSDTGKMKRVSASCTNAIHEIKGISNSLTTLQNDKQNCKIYIALKNARVASQSLQNSLEKAENANIITQYHFQHGSQLPDLLKKSDALGKISVTNLVHSSTATCTTSDVADEPATIPHKPILTVSDGMKTTQHSYSIIQAGNKSDKIKLAVPLKESQTMILKNKDIQAKYIADIDIISKRDTKGYWISGSVVLAPGKLVVTDYHNKKVKVIDTQQHSLVSEIQLNVKPWDVTLVKPDQLAVTLLNVQIIQYLDITQKCDLSKSRTISVNGDCHGIAFAKDRLVVSFIFPRKVEILTLNGDVQHTIATDAAGQELFTRPEYLALSPDGDTIYVSDYDTHTVTSLTTTGNVLSVYRNDQLTCPTGIAVAADGTVYVFGDRSGNVHMLTAQCELIKVVKDKHWDSQSISYCDDNKQLYIGSGNIKVYQLT